MNNGKCNLFIVILNYRVSLEKIDAFKSEHLEFLNNYYAKGFFIASGPQVPRNGGIIIAKCSSKDSLQRILAQDPFAVKDLATYEVLEFSPTKYTNQLESLLS